MRQKQTADYCLDPMSQMGLAGNRNHKCQTKAVLWAASACSIEIQIYYLCSPVFLLTGIWFGKDWQTLQEMKFTDKSKTTLYTAYVLLQQSGTHATSTYALNWQIRVTWPWTTLAKPAKSVIPLSILCVHFSNVNGSITGPVSLILDTKNYCV